MKTYNIILIIILQSFIFVAFSQEIGDGYQISTETYVTSPGKLITSFKDVNYDNYKGHPKDKEGKKLWDPDAKFSSKEKMKRIEREVYSEEERNYMFQYIPLASVKYSACDGKIVSIEFSFVNLPNSSVIDTKKLKRFQERIMDETYFENITFRGGEATSGYLPGVLWLFRP